ncbi:sortase [Halalkalibacterium halodurans]|uniref:BH2127 protein n=1 Tax=Halalkalibacterium halodurans (strain ATCC BAA-125 / DSM 18197 / FERM 7344 / JCM 9153 / C-125) TaxID=272558 RepID=Q9KB09_HALH5|nr:sortase [Halalkalibacterium halodurans]MED3647608.1 sortase [Halalkalibacterium halodurans]MED4123535.1 sortase [Halalkalibacterium halodurans]MED4172277.1 sortase [Halalkalibacterium halodurans]TES51633.1 sortase [Halalkalibacterium halodurans]BAB05846.1 BH2127 [Halalkalibacterium halodurans C-125]
MRTITAVLFISFGLLFMFFPRLQTEYYSFYETRLIDSYEKINRELEAFSNEEPHLLSSEEPHAIGVLEIEKISLKLPVLQGVDQETLKVGAGHMIESSPIGEKGNAAIAAHRSRTYGRQFNRLDEVEVGDVITVTTNNHMYRYTVYSITVVEPTNIDILQHDGTAPVLTLITCDPVKDPTHRLIVQAEMTEALY